MDNVFLKKVVLTIALLFPNSFFCMEYSYDWSHDCAEYIKNSFILPAVSIYRSIVTIHLYRAAGDGNLRKINILLKVGAEIEPKNETTPLWNAIGNSQYAAAKLLLHKGADPNNQKFPAGVKALYKNDAKMLAILLDHGLDIRRQNKSLLVQNFINDEPQKISFLYYAGKYGYSACIEELLKRAIDEGKESEALLKAVQFSNGSFNSVFINANYERTIKALLYVEPTLFQKLDNKTASELTNDEHLKQLLSDPEKIKGYCSKKEQKEFDDMLEKRYMTLFKQMRNPIKNGNIAYQLMHCESTGRFPTKKINNTANDNKLINYFSVFKSIN